MNDERSLWEKIDVDEYLAAQASSNTATDSDASSEPASDREKRRRRAFWRAMRVIAAAIWIYVPLKLFVGDIDRWIVEHVSPALVWLLDYRFFILLGLAAVGLLVLRKWKYLGALVYIGFFPLIVVFYYAPRWLVRQPTWIPAVGLLNVLWRTLRSVRFTVPAMFLFAISALVIWRDAAAPLQVGAIGVLLGMWGVLVVRTFVASMRPASFIRAQQKALARAQSGTFGKSILALPEGHLSGEVQKLTKPQIDTVVTNASFGVLLYATGYFLADQLERYRKSSASMVFAVLGVMLLFTEAIAIFSLVNLGVFQLAPDQFLYVGEPTLLTMIRYTLSSFQLGEISALQPVGGAASAVAIYAGLSVYLILVTLLVALVFSFRSSRESAEAADAIERLRKESDDYAERVVEAYRLPLEDLIKQLMRMGFLMNLWLRFVSDTIGTYRRQPDEGP